MDTASQHGPGMLCFGEILWDVIDGHEHIGGAPFNLAAHLARLGADVRMITRVGRDDRGQRALAEAQKLGVDDELIQIDPVHPTGWVDVALAGGQPSYTIHEDVAFDYIEYDAKLQQKLLNQSFSAFCFGSLCQRGTVSRDTLHAILDGLDSTEVFLDINLRQRFYTVEIIRNSLSRATILKLNDEEAVALSEMLFGRRLDARGFAAAVADGFRIGTVCITMGENGCGVYHDGRFETIPGVRVDVADAVGAGDAFSAGFLHRLCRGADPYESARFGNRLGAFVASRRGAVPEYDGEIISRRTRRTATES